MAISPSFINPGAPVKSSIPLVQKSLGIGLGFKNQASVGEKDQEEITVDLSLSLKSRSSKTQISQKSISSKSSASPLMQALDVLANIAKKISSLQDKYAKLSESVQNSESISSELADLSKEFKRITTSEIFKQASSAGNFNSDLGSGSLGFNDSGIKSIFESNDQSRIESFKDGIDGLVSISFDNILSDRSLSKSIQNYISEIKSAFKQDSEQSQNPSKDTQSGNTVIITAPQVSIQTVGQTEGLSVSLLSYSNEDIIKAAASHIDLEATNVLLLTFDAPEQESEEQKKAREEKAQMIEIENPE